MMKKMSDGALQQTNSSYDCSMNEELQIGDIVLYLLDGDIGVIAAVDFSNRPHSDGLLEPYYVEWYIHPEQSGWHSVYACDDHSSQVMVRLGA